MSALLYSFYTGFPIVYTRVRKPFRFDHFSPYFDLDGIVAQTEPAQIETLSSSSLIGQSKTKMWAFLFFSLSLSGRILFSGKVNSIRIQENKLKAITKRTREVLFDKLIIFDDHELYGIGRPVTNSSTVYTVYDWINVHSGASHKFDLFEYPRGEVIKKIIFYPSDRVNGKHNLKDIVVVSEMSEEQLSDYRFSDTYVRFRAEQEMKSAGIRGKRNGRDQKNPKRYKYYALKLSASDREVSREGFSLIIDQENASVNERTPEEIIEQFRGTKPAGYLGRVTRCIKKHTFI